MEQEILDRIKNNEEKLDRIFVSVEKIRKYFFWTMMITIAVVILPLIGLLFAVPQFLNTYGQIGGI